MFLFIQRMEQQKHDIVLTLAEHFHGNKCTVDQLDTICNDLLKSPVVAVHCKAGKGRTGLIICSFLLFTEQFETVEEAIRHYDKTRTKNEKALTIDSQIRQVYHFKNFLDNACASKKGSGGGKKNYIKNSLRNYKLINDELDKLENCDENHFKNSLKFFTLTFGPFEEKPPMYAIKKDNDKEENKNENPQIEEQKEWNSSEEEGLRDEEFKNQEEKPDQVKGEGDSELIELIQKQEIKLQFHKLRDDGSVEQIWDLKEFIEYNKEKTGLLFKNIVRKQTDVSTGEQYIIVMLEKIQDELFKKPFFGYIRVNVQINKMNLSNGKLQVNQQIKFYFWLNIAGICTITNKEGNISNVFKNYKYVQVNPRELNGFKLMSDEKQMMNLILPDVQNQGEKAYQEYQNMLHEEKQRKLAALNKAKIAGAGGDDKPQIVSEQNGEGEEIADEEAEKKEESKVMLNGKELLKKMEIGIKRRYKTYVKECQKQKEMDAKIALMQSMRGIVGEFYSKDTSCDIPNMYT